MSEPLPPVIEHKLQQLLQNFLQGKELDEEVLAELNQYLPRKTMADIDTEYRIKLGSEVQQMQQEARQKRVSQLLDNCEVSPNWDFSYLKANGDKNYEHALHVCKVWAETFMQMEQGYMGTDYVSETNPQTGVKVSKPAGRSYRTPGALLYLYGSYGVGKSSLAGAIARYVIKTQMREVIFMQWFSIVRKMHSIRNEGDELEKWFEKLYNVDLLVIDEVCADTAKLTEPQRRDLGQILRGRKNLHRNTIIISNAGPEELYHLVGEFCWESIKNYKEVTALQVPGPNRRVATIGNFNNSVTKDMQVMQNNRNLAMREEDRYFND